MTGLEASILDSPRLYVSVPGDGDAVEPDVEVDDVVFDASGFPWTKAEGGFMAAGDWRVQSWDQIRRWF